MCARQSCECNNIAFASLNVGASIDWVFVTRARSALMLPFVGAYCAQTGSCIWYTVVGIELQMLFTAGAQNKDIRR